jgi:hypothetical protein
MRVAVVTPHHSARPEWLDQCIESVKAQTHPCDHFVVCDGVPPPARADVKFFQTPAASRDYGDTPRALGSISAFSLGYEAVAWLDDDNWFAPDHVETMIRALLNQRVQVVTSTRYLVTREGQVMGVCRETDPERFIDSNCYLVHASARWVVNAWWMMSEDLHMFGDRVVTKFMRTHGASLWHTGRPTVYYRTNFANHYREFGFAPPPDAPRPLLEVYRRRYGRDPII